MLSFSFVLFIISDNLCEYGATWRLVEQEQIQYIEFELFGDIKSSSGFISLVFSKDPYFMGPVAYHCSHYDVMDLNVFVDWYPPFSL
uniref:CUB domain-containing protein n=1 Tax=Mesocestoides corti TaxID=53468 RepID=A0A5K3EET3_MESCO